ncbi:bifunctional 3-(3-hydroxy-phenyl)propionate/3-hydroxycinnamic acid hydroxylase [Solimonas sp. K1W22B-7]|uniref:bifunctional 3-(3-hydroxy-phenyl)propionate/3-hydroxycinnamic acid hydroxylase n=1 Tax=Solimonas sp. K1W22B-7 TaxID=2303331 RepID=UPI000E32EE8E|nr:bifunctional 3-(3-hydroxy-phenyl)propionate/3-hydroxycinnamic acid hydroxylase [Solimonas sp. K1W22B-7]AXQ27729.1 bifunctional 3-(3-hydroxy-phenyl)propionate/3-hydroxycinnamic acid hydroxylase [Solimonas sp. K1W22B-7]
MNDKISIAETALPEQVSVLVVGYGPVGAAIGCLLGRQGVRTLIVDKASDILTQPRAIALDNEALRILQMVGLDEQAFERVAIPEVRMHSPLLGQFGRVNSAGSIDGHPKLVTFFQPELEAALRRQVRALDSVRTACGVEFLDFVDDGKGVTVRLRDADGVDHRVRADFLVAADGASSLVRRMIGQDFGGATYPEDWLIVDALNVPKPIDHIEFICDPKRPIPHMPAPGQRERWEFMLAPGETREQMETDERIGELLRPWGDLGQMKIERRAVYRFHARCCDSFRKGLVFLAGDAAHITPPFVGQGLVAGLRDAANLCWKLAAVVQGKASPAILDSYDQERRPHARAMIGLAKLMGSLVMPRNSLVALLTHGSVRLLRLLPPLRRFLDDLGIKPKNRFAKGLFARGHRQLERGGQLPQGLVRNSRGDVVLSDTLLDGGPTLVGFGLHPRSTLNSAQRQAWEAAGGRFVQICHRSQVLHKGEGAAEDLQGALLPGAAPFGWVAVVRPDRVVLHDGPAAEASRIVHESLVLLGAHCGSHSITKQTQGRSHA